MSDIISEEEFKELSEKLLWDMVTDLEAMCINFKKSFDDKTAFFMRWRKMYNDEMPLEAEEKIDSLIYFHGKNIVVVK